MSLWNFNRTREGYEVDEETINVVRRIFRMVGVEGRTLHDVCSALRREGVPTPGGRKLWSPTFVRNVVKNDVYRPHTFEEVRKVVTEQVASALDPEERYGLWWYNKNRIQSKQTAKSVAEPRETRKRPVADLIVLDESATLEFKSTLLRDVAQNQPNKHLRHSIIKTIAAFLNSEGDTLLNSRGRR